jgi:hypothetical protein
MFCFLSLKILFHTNSSTNVITSGEEEEKDKEGRNDDSDEHE